MTVGRDKKPLIEQRDYAAVVGGADQAWVYLEEMGDLWRATPQALEWMEQRR